jgi:hypothetical protein
MTIIDSLLHGGKKHALEKLVNELWEVLPCVLKAFTCCCMPCGKIAQIKAIGALCSCVLPEKAQELLPKVIKMADEIANE